MVVLSLLLISAYFSVLILFRTNLKVTSGFSQTMYVLLISKPSIVIRNTLNL